MYLTLKDCGGKTCVNGGQLDANTCQCQCKGFWEGDNCEKGNLKKCISKDLKI